MYKYLPIAQNVQEMMIMLKSLPAYTLLFDYRSNLVDMNESAKHLFRVECVQEFNERKEQIFSTPDYIKTIVLELKRGKTVRNARTLFIHADNSISIVELCACMISGKPDYYLFQLFELSPITNSSIGSYKSDASANILEDSVGNNESIISTETVLNNSKSILEPRRTRSSKRTYKQKI